MARRKDKVVVRVVGASLHGVAARVPRGADRHKRSGAGSHGGSVRQKHRRTRQQARRELRRTGD